jgi:hypothetical protein
MRKLAVVLLILLFAGSLLLLSSCGKEAGPAPEALMMKKGGGPGDSWPPDTLKVKLIGDGRLLVIASWMADSAGLSPMQRLLECPVTVEFDTTPNVHPNPVPPPGPGHEMYTHSPTVTAKKAIDVRLKWRTIDALVLVPDTTYSIPGGGH